MFSPGKKKKKNANAKRKQPVQPRHAALPTRQGASPPCPSIHPHAPTAWRPLVLLRAAAHLVSPHTPFPAESTRTLGSLVLSTTESRRGHEITGTMHAPSGEQSQLALHSRCGLCFSRRRPPAPREIPWDTAASTNQIRIRNPNPRKRRAQRMRFPPKMK